MRMSRTWLFYLLLVPFATAFVASSNERIAWHDTRLASQSTVRADDHHPHPKVDDVDKNNAMGWSRRRLFQSSVAAVTTAASLGSVPLPSNALAVPQKFPTPVYDPDLYWPTGKVACSLLPLAGTNSRRATVEQVVVPDTIWTHDQIQGVVNVNVPVRQTVIRLQSGGLWVHNPVAPTPQLIKMMRNLEAKYGPVQHIVLGTVALEHKATFGAFASYFPDATVWIQPGQWAFPVDLPIEFYGLQQRGRKLRELPVPGQPLTRPLYAPFAKDDAPSWKQEIDYEVLGPFKFKSVGGFSETAFYHKATQSLIVTDTVCSVTADPPAIIAQDPRGLFFHARNRATDDVDDTVETRRRGWRRMVQFGLVFFPSQIKVSSVGEAFDDARHVPADLTNLGLDAVPGKLYPWSWPDDVTDQANFDAISQGGKLFCPPILTKLILDREPEATLEWVDRVVQRFPQTQRVLACHLNGNVKATVQDFSQAFDPLRSRPGNLVPQRALVEDLALLQKASDVLTKLNVVAPSLVCDGEPARNKGRFAQK